jgi:hypothetical protein
VRISNVVSLLARETYEGNEQALRPKHWLKVVLIHVFCTRRQVLYQKTTECTQRQQDPLFVTHLAQALRLEPHHRLLLLPLLLQMP